MAPSQQPIFPSPRMLFRLAGTPVQADASAPLSLVVTYGLCWAVIRQRYAGMQVWVRMILAGVWTVLAMMVFALHSLGHILSARAAGAPMDTLMINAVHWVTLYANDNVPPEAHIGRSVGGPLANLSGILLVRGLRSLLPKGPFGRDLVDVFGAFNLAIGGAALLPAPSFDGGVLLKWAVYQHTGDVQAASNAVQTAGVQASMGLAVLSGGALISGKRLAGTVLAAFSLVAALEALQRH